MNQVERMLNEEVNWLIDRLATSVPDGCLGDVKARTPTLRNRVDEAESQLAAVRASILDGYGRWRRALEDLENLWALAAWKCAGPEAAAGPEAPPAPDASAPENTTEQSRSLAA